MTTMSPAVGMSTPGNLTHWHFWAKLKDRKGPDYHPVACHLTDVGMVARAMWERVIPDATKSWASTEIGLDGSPESIAATGDWIALWAASHDLGKLSPVFQACAPVAVDYFAKQGVSFHKSVVGNDRDKKLPTHGDVSALLLRTVLQEAPFQLPQSIACDIATIVGGHHGVLPPDGRVDRADFRWFKGDAVWANLRAQLLGDLIAPGVLPVPALRPVRLTRAVSLWLAGFISVADWIGSDDRFFRLKFTGWSDTHPLDLAAYAGEASEQAQKALDALGWLDRPAWEDITSGAAPDGDAAEWFNAYFGFATPNAMQRQVTALARELPAPALVIIEAPMGQGKTEAAIALADRWARQTGNPGFYLALPTQATSNLIFSRTLAYLRNRYPHRNVGVQLLHGLADVNAEVALLRKNQPNAYGVALPEKDDPVIEPEGLADDAQGGLVSETGVADGPTVTHWFTYRKRGLLAPFGVGTVDQILLAALRTPHVFVRLHGLAGKTIVIDEVHAYDAYMSTLLERLLEWLAALGSPVVLLSATLPDASRRALALAYAAGRRDGDTESVTLPAAEYPRITWVTAEGEGGAVSIALERDSTGATAQVTNAITIRRLPVPPDGSSESTEVDFIREKLRNGGTAVFICTTVKRAQEKAKQFRAAFADGGPEVDLFHARFMAGRRQQIEEEVIQTYGKGSEAERKVVRPARLLVATQVVEQSLDLDFDLMISDPAPVDLLLQRAGRLHRHQRERPDGLKERELFVIPPDPNSGQLHDGGAQFVYDGFVMLRTWVALRECFNDGAVTVRIPEDVGPLIEAVYGEDTTPPDWLSEAQLKRWDDELRDYRAEQSTHKHLAGQKFVKPPANPDDPRDLSLASVMSSDGEVMDEDAPHRHKAFQALTRLSDGPSVTAICLVGEPDNYRLAPIGPEDSADGAPRVSFRAPLHHDQLADILRRTVNITDPRIAPKLVEAEPPPGKWGEHRLLKSARIIVLDNPDPKLNAVFRHDPWQGLIVEKAEGSERPQ